MATMTFQSRKRGRAISYTRVETQSKSGSQGLSPVFIKAKMHMFNGPDSMIRTFQVLPHQDVDPNRPMFYITDKDYAGTNRDDLMLLSLPAVNKILRQNAVHPETLPDRLRLALAPDRFHGPMQLFDVIRSAGILAQPAPSERSPYNPFLVSLKQQGIADYIPNLWGNAVPGDTLGWRSAIIVSEADGIKHPVILPHLISAEHELDFSPDRIENVGNLTEPSEYLQRSVSWFSDDGLFKQGDFILFGKVIRRYCETPSARAISEALFSSIQMNSVERGGRLDIAVLAHQRIQTVLGPSLPDLEKLNLTFDLKTS